MAALAPRGAPRPCEHLLPLLSTSLSLHLSQGTPADKVSLRDIFGPGKKGVLFAVPGAFTPGCSKTHLPGFVAKADALKAAGADAVVCVCPNDPFVTAAWGEANGAGGKVIMLADTQLALTKAWDQVLDAEEALGSKRSKRYSVVIADGKVSAFNAEPDGTGLTCSLADPTLAQLQAA